MNYLYPRVLCGLFVGSFLFSAILLPSVNADTPSYFVDWQTSSPHAGGHICIVCPSVLAFNQTYQIKSTITLEYAEDVNTLYFGLIQWLLVDQNGNTQTLGYSVIKPLGLHESIDVISHWSLPNQPMNGPWTLRIKTSVSTLTPSPEDPSNFSYSPEITLMVKQKANLTLTYINKNVVVGDQINLKGELSPASLGALINLTYVKPNGDKVTRWTVADETGKFSDKLAADADGLWLAQATWTGTSTMSVDPSSVVVFNVEKQGYLTIIAIGIVVAIAVLGPFIIRWAKPSSKVTFTK